MLLLLVNQSHKVMKMSYSSLQNLIYYRRQRVNLDTDGAAACSSYRETHQALTPAGSGLVLTRERFLQDLTERHVRYHAGLQVQLPVNSLSLHHRHRVDCIRISLTVKHHHYRHPAIQLGGTGGQ